MPATQAPSKLLEAFFESFTRTVKEFALHFLLAIATIVYGLKSPDFTNTFWQIAIPLSWAVCLEVIWHVLKAAVRLSKAVSQDSTRSTIVSHTGEPFERTSEPVPYFQLHLWGMAIGVVVLSVCFGALVRQVAIYDTRTPSIAQPTPASPPPVAVFIDCRLIPLPVPISAQSMIHVLALNKGLVLSQSWGLDDITNQTDHRQEWPSMAQLKKPKAFDFAYKCDVSNHSPTNLLDVAIQTKILFGQSTDAQGIFYSVVASPLDAGSHFVFYVTNDCPASAVVQLPNIVTANAVGDSLRRAYPLNFPDRTPLVQQFLMLFGSSVQFVRQRPCLD